MNCGVVVKRLFSWDYEREEERATEIKSQISLRNAICVVTDHNWAHENHSLEVYVPVHIQPADFKGGIYEEIQAVERAGIDEAEAYEVLAEVLREGYPVKLHYDANRKSLAIFRFRPKLDSVAFCQED